MSEYDEARRALLPMACITVLALAVVLAQDPVPQDPAYHDFADQRTLLGIPHFWNVVSNLPFLVIGLAGAAAVASGRARGVLPGLQPACIAFFLAAAGVGPGSAWYHLRPDDATLLWDRLPMSVAFMAFFAIMLGERLGPGVGRRALGPLLVLGPASVLWWWLGELRGAGDLRAYGLVQFLPLLLIPLLLVLAPSRLTGSGLLWLTLGAYAVAKLCEDFDAALYASLGVGGHALKHLAAAGGVLAFLLAVMTRRIRAGQAGGRAAGPARRGA